MFPEGSSIPGIILLVLAAYKYEYQNLTIIVDCIDHSNRPHGTTAHVHCHVLSPGTTQEHGDHLLHGISDVFRRQCLRYKLIGLSLRVATTSRLSFHGMRFAEREGTVRTTGAPSTTGNHTPERQEQTFGLKGAGSPNTPLVQFSASTDFLYALHRLPPPYLVPLQAVSEPPLAGDHKTVCSR